jgi:group I intron endonuclease
MKVMGVYKITCLENGKIYIGSTVNFDKRRKEHWRLLKGNYHTNKYLQRAWNKYGAKQFKIELIEELNDQELLLSREQYWINITNCATGKIGFNLTPTAGGTYGYKYTAEQKANCGKWIRNEELRDKLRTCHLGLRASASTKKKMSIQRSGNKNAMYGKQHTEESRLKMSETRIRKGVGRGINHNKAKLTDDNIREIRKLFKEGLTATEIAKKYNVSKSTTARINKGLLWSHIEG